MICPGSGPKATHSLDFRTGLSRVLRNRASEWRLLIYAMMLLFSTYLISVGWAASPVSQIVACQCRPGEIE